MKTFYLLAIACLVLKSSIAQNIGAGQPNPAAKLDINGNLIVGTSLSGTLANAHLNGASIEGQSTIGTDVTIRTYELLRSNSYGTFRDAINGYSALPVGIGVFGRSMEYRGGEFQSRGDYINDGAAGLMAFNNHHLNGVAGLFQTLISNTATIRSQNLNTGIGQSWLTTNDFDQHTSAGTFINSTQEGTAVFAFSDGDGLEGTGAAVLGVSSVSDPVVGITPASHIAGVVGKNIHTGTTVTDLLTIGILGIIEHDDGDKVAAVEGEVRSTNSAGISVFGKFQTPVNPNSNAAGGVFNLGYSNKVRLPYTDATAGVRSSGIECGVYGYAQADGLPFSGSGPVTPSYNTTLGGEFESSTAATYANIGIAVCHNGTSYKVRDLVAAGSVVSTARMGVNNQNVTLFAPEAPSPMYEDWGHGQLLNGKAQINLDDNLKEMIFVSVDKPLKVMIQMEGDCKGVYVTNKSKDGFDVIELQGGQSNSKFTYHVIAHASDVIVNGEVLNKLQDLRFPILPNKGNVALSNYKDLDLAVEMGRTIANSNNTKIASPNPEAFMNMRIQPIKGK